MPLWANDAFSGILSVQSYAANAYAHADARRVLQVADYVALGLRVSRPRPV